MSSTFTTDKGYELQATGENNGIWGVKLNNNFSIIDLNFGGLLVKAVGGSSNITPSASDCENVYHRLTGVLTGNIKYILPNTGSFYFIQNSTTGNFTITVVSNASGVGVIVPQSTTALIFVDSANTSVLNGLTITSNTFSAGTSAGTNTITATASSGYALTLGNIIVFKAGGTCTGAVTLNISGSGALAFQKLGNALVSGDITLNDIVVAVYDGTQYQMVSPARTPVLTANSIALTKLAQVNANTVLVNNTSSTGNVTTQALASSQFIARGNSGDIGAGTLGSGLAFSTLALDVVNFVGDSGSGGVHGAVPAPAAGDAAAGKFLKASGDWSVFGLTLGTIQASTSGTSIDFTSIPVGIKRVTVQFSGVSTNGTSHLLIQIGDSGGIENTGYDSSSSQIAGTVSSANSTAGFIVLTGSAATVRSGSLILNLMDAATNLWTITGNTNDAVNTSTFTSAGSKATSATLDRVRITTVNGTDVFDAGKINIAYE